MQINKRQKNFARVVGYSALLLIWLTNKSMLENLGLVSKAFLFTWLAIDLYGFVKGTSRKMKKKEETELAQGSVAVPVPQPSAMNNSSFDVESEDIDKNKWLYELNGVKKGTDVDVHLTDPSPEISSTMPPETKWYDKSTLWWTILFWPAFVYGIYKTSLINKKTKQIIAGVFVVLIIIGSFTEDKGGSGVVRQSPWDNSVDCVEYYIKHSYLNDPDSYESIKWGKVTQNPDGTYEVIHSFRARNGFGGMVKETKIFTIASDGWTIINVQG